MSSPTLPPEKSITLILGGARSGKSRLGEALTTAIPPPWTYIATAEPLDDEMRARIAAHQASRLPGWRTVEAPLRLADTLAHEAEVGRPILIDCLTLWLSNHLLAAHDLEAEIKQLASAIAATPVPLAIVSNEVGMGVVPETPLGRAFRDHQGRLNAEVAAIATRVVFMAAGLPLILKGPPL
jgi:adenosylcobinamide kinase / adenosylcobinamide-phosphate guanylyltransferase